MKLDVGNQHDLKRFHYLLNKLSILIIEMTLMQLI